MSKIYNCIKRDILGDTLLFIHPKKENAKFFGPQITVLCSKFVTTLILQEI